MAMNAALSSPKSQTMTCFILLSNLLVAVLQKKCWISESKTCEIKLHHRPKSSLFIRYDDSDVLGDRITVSWFKDLRKAKQKRKLVVLVIHGQALIICLLSLYRYFPQQIFSRRWLRSSFQPQTQASLRWWRRLPSQTSQLFSQPIVIESLTEPRA